MSKIFRSFFLNLIGNRKAGEQDHGKPWETEGADIDKLRETYGVDG